MDERTGRTRDEFARVDQIFEKEWLGVQLQR
jgi:hypothetical protein